MSKELYQCPECGLHYRDKKRMQQCQEFCSANHACNLEITKYSVEEQRSKA